MGSPEIVCVENRTTALPTAWQECPQNVIVMKKWRDTAHEWQRTAPVSFARSTSGRCCTSSPPPICRWSTKASVFWLRLLNLSKKVHQHRLERSLSRQSHGFFVVPVP